MKYDPERHNRRSIRLKNYDYTSAGAYFVTICVKNRECLFGNITDGTVQLNSYGEIVNTVWHGLPDHYPHVELDAWVVMPNHVHGIILLTNRSAVTTVGAGFKPDPTGVIADDQHPANGDNNHAKSNQKRHGLPEIVRAFKTFSSRRINEMRKSPGTPVWQRNYYENIVRDELSLNRIRQYIAQNPVSWSKDRDNSSISEKRY
jgi:REP element-mobilizing transposase RayT